MIPRVLILENNTFCPESNILRDLSSRMPCERRAWNSFVPETLKPEQFQLVLANTVPNTERAMEFFLWLRKNPIPIPIVTVLQKGEDQESFRTIVELTDDFVLHPVQEEELLLRIQKIVEPQPRAHTLTRKALGREIAFEKLVGNHPSFLQALHQVPLFGASNAPVLITGETGTGKELFAHAVHSLSKRHSGPFIPVDCGTLPEQLAENELFGHCRGAFTDAHADQKGLAALAEGGTLFLDEIDALSLVNQSKLLRFLQEGSYRALGSDRFTRTNVRIVAATNRSIEEAVRQRQFRGDLYFRLNVLRLTLSPLRERREDIAVLANFFLENEHDSSSCKRKVFSSSALTKLGRYDWPGNVRELSNAIQRAVLCCSGQRIMPNHISLWDETRDNRNGESSGDCFKSAKRRAVEAFERTYVRDLLVRHQGNVSRAAREAGKDRRAFGRLVKKYSIGDTPPSCLGQ